MTVKTINSKILGNNRERIADDSKSNHATNTAETFFVVVVFVCFALGNVWDGCLCGRSSSLIFKETLLLTTYEESQSKENHDYLNLIHDVTLWCNYVAVKILRDWPTSFVWSWWLDIGCVFIAFFSRSKNVKIITPGDFNLLTTLINCAEVIYYILIKYQVFYMVCFDFWTYVNHFYSVHFRMSKLSKSDRIR